MNYVGYTLSLINKIEPRKRVLLVGAGFRFNSRLTTNEITIVQNDLDIDLNDWIQKYLHNDDYKTFNYVILSRVLEHFPIRSLDWYLYNIYTIMSTGAKLICVVPDMKACAKELENEFEGLQKDNISKPDTFRVNRLTYELLSEGKHVWDRHATWTSESSIKHYLEMEGLFKIDSINRIRIDSDIVPQELEIIATRR